MANELITSSIKHMMQRDQVTSAIQESFELVCKELTKQDLSIVQLCGTVSQHAQELTELRQNCENLKRTNATIVRQNEDLVAFISQLERVPTNADETDRGANVMHRFTNKRLRITGLSIRAMVMYLIVLC